MANTMNKLFKIADTIEDSALREKYLEILRDSMPEKMWIDKYHLTMPQTSFLEGTANDIATYEMTIRKNPFNGNYTVAAGLGPFLEWLNDYGFSDDTINWLAKCRENDGTPSFRPEFLNFLRDQKLSITIDAMPEGGLVFPNEPIVRVTGPEWQVALVEAAILNGLNASCLIATKAARIVDAAAGRPVMEFGLRRSQDMFGMRSTRSATVGGILTTSNGDAARKYNLKWVGTHAHSFVMKHDTEIAAFEKWLRRNPSNATVLIDTNDTLRGVQRAIQASRNTGVPLRGVRLDSGDMAQLSIKVNELLAAAGMRECKILVSNDLDEYAIPALLKQNAIIDTFAVGTNLVTASDQPSLGGVYKLKSINGQDKMKISDDAIKRTIPGATEILRMVDGDGKFDGDVITSVNFVMEAFGQLESPITSVDPKSNRVKIFPAGTLFYKPMVRVVTDGRVDMKHAKCDLREIAAGTKHNLEQLKDAHKSLNNPERYVAGIEQGLFMKQAEMLRTNQGR